MKNIFVLLVILVLFVISSDSVSADTPVAGASAAIKAYAYNKKDYRVETLSKFLESQGSPLTPFAKDFVETADANSLDWRLIPAITGVESSFGKEISYNSFNAYGWAAGAYRFASWKDSIEVVSNSLRKDYVEKGATTIWQIGRIYCPPNPNWAGKVLYFMQKIEPDSLKFTLDS